MRKYSIYVVGYIGAHMIVQKSRQQVLRAYCPIVYTVPGKFKPYPLEIEL
jgi:hypothetical protein